MRYADITYRQLDHWARAGVVPPDVLPLTAQGQSGYSFKAVTRLAVVKRLPSLGISLPDLDRIISANPTGTISPIAGVPIDLNAIADEVRRRMFQTPGPYSDSA